MKVLANIYCDLGNILRIRSRPTCWRASGKHSLGSAVLRSLSAALKSSAMVFEH